LSNFYYAVERLLQEEGGYVNDPDDPGGETKYGITKRTYPQLDIASLTKFDAERIYREDWWTPLHLEGIDDREVAAKTLSLCVNMGGAYGIKMLQRACRATGGAVADDGRLGHVTLASVNVSDWKALLAALKSEAAGHYRLLVERRPVNKKYLKGWLNRAYR